MQTPADPKDHRSPNKQTIESTALEIQHDRGIIYVYRRDGLPLLKITGLPTPIAELANDSGAAHQLTIEIVSRPANSETGPYLGVVERSRTNAADAAAANVSNAHTKAILKQAGATVIGSGEQSRPREARHERNHSNRRSRPR